MNSPELNLDTSLDSGVLTLTELVALEQIGTLLRSHNVADRDMESVAAEILSSAVRTSSETDVSLGDALWDAALALQAEF